MYSDGINIFLTHQVRTVGVITLWIMSCLIKASTNTNSDLLVEPFGSLLVTFIVGNSNHSRFRHRSVHWTRFLDVRRETRTLSWSTPVVGQVVTTVVRHGGRLEGPHLYGERYRVVLTFVESKIDGNMDPPFILGPAEFLSTTVPSLLQGPIDSTPWFLPHLLRSVLQGDWSLSPL